MVETGKVSNRPKLHFDTLIEVRHYVEKLAAAEADGSLTQLGNWTLGQAVNHLGAWVGYGFTGPPGLPPWFIRWIMKPMKGKVLNGSMPAGIKIPGIPGGAFATEIVPTLEAMKKYFSLLERLERENPGPKHPIFGRFTHDDWKRLNLRHAELHLSFFLTR